jgi:hypothetical protein
MADFRWHADAKSQQITKAKAEMEEALLAHDKFLRGLKPPMRLFIRNTLMFLARLKRYVLKFLRGAYV